MSVLAIVGSRRYPRLSEVRHYVRARIAHDPSLTIVSGGALGVDTEAERAAEMMGAAVVSFRPLQVGSRFVILRLDALLGVRAEIIPCPSCSTYAATCYERNRLIVEEADEVKAFWDLSSPGTRHTISLAREAGKLIEAEGPVAADPSNAEMPASPDKEKDRSACSQP